MFFVETLNNGTIKVLNKEDCFISEKIKFIENFYEDAYFFNHSDDTYEISENVYHLLSNEGFNNINMKYVFIITGVDGTSLNISKNDISKNQYKYFSSNTNKYKYFINDKTNGASIEVSLATYNRIP
ncbi:MAG: hypothetical protein ACRCRT_02770 [Cetobacterium somerae]